MLYDSAPVTWEEYETHLSYALNWNVWNLDLWNFSFFFNSRRLFITKFCFEIRRKPL
jgi:hypothetical protein